MKIDPIAGVVPRHVAIIMDGNGRGRTALAAALGRPPPGRRSGRRAVRAASELGIAYLTIYSFSSRELVAPPRGNAYLLRILMRRFVRQDVAELHAANVRILVIGERDGLRPATSCR